MPPTLPTPQVIRLHRVQREFRRSTALYKGFVGGRGSGKSWIGAYDLLRRAKAGRTYLVVSPTSSKLLDETFPTIKQIAEALEIWQTPKMTPYPTVKLSTGATIRFRSGDKPDSLRGPNLSGIWLDEASLMDEEVFTITIGCLREAGEQGWASATFTPKGVNHWTYQRFGTTYPDTELFHSPTKDNPFLPPNFAGTLEKQYHGLWRDQELGGLFVSMEGAEWPSEWFDDILFDFWPDGLEPKVMALDPSKGSKDKTGDYSAWIMLGLDRDGTLWFDCDADNSRPVESLASNPDGRSIVSDGFRLYKEFKPTGIICETNGFQSLAAEAMARHGRENNTVLPLYGVSNTVPKTQRIRELGPFLAQRRVRIKNTPGGRLLVAQLRDFPVGQHDDCPDAAVLAISLANYLCFGDQEGNRVQVLVS